MRYLNVKISLLILINYVIIPTLSNYHRINTQIRSAEVRVIGAEGENLGVLRVAEALAKAKEAGLDLIEISPNANPPITKIEDYGKFLYTENKKQKASKIKVHTTEVKNIQIKIGTGDHDLGLKAKRASGWIKEGHRIKVDLFLPGRTKYMNEKFLKERIGRFLNLLTIEYKADSPQKSLKGMTVIIEKK